MKNIAKNMAKKALKQGPNILASIQKSLPQSAQSSSPPPNTNIDTLSNDISSSLYEKIHIKLGEHPSDKIVEGIDTILKDSK